MADTGCEGGLIYFNPRPPRGGRRQLKEVVQLVLVISIHAPREGGDWVFLRIGGASKIFQSTPPARGATMLQASKAVNVRISIHAPREGGDTKLTNAATGDDVFQSTPPARGATVQCPS